MKPIRIWQYLISVLVILSLLLNVFLIITLLDVEEGLGQATMAARSALEDVAGEPLTVTVKVDQNIPISTTVPLSETLVLPVSFDFPFSTVVNTHIDIPLLGRQNISVPVEATVPISETFELPIQMTVPISMTYPLHTKIPVQVQVPQELILSIENFIDGFEEGLHFSFR